MTKFGTKYT